MSSCSPQTRSRPAPGIWFPGGCLCSRCCQQELLSRRLVERCCGPGCSGSAAPGAKDLGQVRAKVTAAPKLGSPGRGTAPDAFPFARSTHTRVLWPPVGSERAIISPADTHRPVWQGGEHAQRLDQHRIQTGMVGEGCPGAGGGRNGVDQGRERWFGADPTLTVPPKRG